ncbi:uncharacterized protein LOC128992179 isoform X2 [Macrosteles quadrilineatus]|uniref:uncharacterized protein LOC128992179 isoform X2 n=1 Tax=Macrosteles quadrilineatus TaxID=74068 RepID=UPI0023E32E48|nr:uncharacterized protein LOC128992179 isoform X2 [Macrosteles quadrilineatus]
MTNLVAMLWMTVAAACMAALLAPVSALSPRRPWFDAEDEPIRRRDLGDVLMAEKRAPFTDTFRNSGRPSRAQDNEILPRGLQVASADEPVTVTNTPFMPWGGRRR